MLSTRVASLLQIRAGEGRQAALMMGLTLFPYAGAAIGLAGAEALFLARVGAEFLPRLYVVLGLTTAATTLGITAVLGRVPALRFYLSLPIVLALLLTAARILVGLDLSWGYGMLWIGAFLFETLQNLLIWGLAGMVFDTRQAKRLFPLFGAAGILGTALGGLITTPLVAQVGTENLVLAWSGMLLVAFGLARVLTRSVTQTRRGSQRRGRVIDNLLAGYQYVRRSRLMTWIALSAVLFSVLFYALAFPFSKTVAQQYPDEDAMSGFLGVFRGMTTAVALVISLFLANRFYARFGLTGGVLSLAALHLVGFSTLAVYGSFATIVGFRFIHESWLGGVTRSAWYALFNIAPPVRREQTRLFINGVALQSGIILIGGVLLIGDQLLTQQGLYLIGALAAALTTFAVWRARHSYLGALVAALRAGRPHVFYSEEEPFGGFQRDANAVAITMTALSDQDPAVRRVAAEVLGNLTVPEAAGALVGALNDPDSQVRAAVLRSLAQAKASSALLDVAARLADPEPHVRVEAIRALHQLADNPKGLIAHVQPLLDDRAAEVRARAAVALLDSERHPLAIQVLLQMAEGEEIESRVQALEGLGAWGDEAAYEPAVAALADSHPEVRRAAASALAHMGGPRCADPLVRALGDENRSVRGAAATALGTLGAAALRPTVEALCNPALEAGALLALAGLPALEEAEAIRAYARERVVSALHYDELRQRINSAARHAGQTELLVDSLRSVSQRNATNALLGVGLLGDADSIALAIDNLSSPNPNQRANAVEILDSLADRDIIRPALRLWEQGANTASSTITHQAIDGSPDEWFVQVLRDADPWLRACAALAADVEQPHIRAELVQLAQTDPDPTVRETAAATLNGGTLMQTLPTLSLMERVLFLRRVPLFVDLPPAELKQVAAIAEEFLFVDGELISHQDDPGDEMYIIVSGEVRVVASANGKGEVELAQRKPGDYVGEMAIISQEPRMASLVAEGDVRVLRIGQQQFEAILRERPETSLAVMRVLCARLREREDSPYERAVASTTGG